MSASSVIRINCDYFGCMATIQTPEPTIGRARRWAVGQGWYAMKRSRTHTVDSCPEHKHGFVSRLQTELSVVRPGDES